MMPRLLLIFFLQFCTYFLFTQVFSLLSMASNLTKKSTALCFEMDFQILPSPGRDEFRNFVWKLKEVSAVQCPALKGYLIKWQKKKSV